MPVTRVGVQAVTGSPGQVVDIDPARITATISNVGSVAVEYSVNSGTSWASIAASGSAAVSCNTNELRLRRTGSGAYPVPVDIDWTAQSEGEANSLTAAQAASAQALVSGAGVSILSAATAGQDSGWLTYYPGMRLAYALDSGSTSTTFSVDISNDGSTSLGQAFTGTWAATTSEITPPLYLTNTQARFIRFNVLTGGPLSVIKF